MGNQFHPYTGREYSWHERFENPGAPRGKSREYTETEQMMGPMTARGLAMIAFFRRCRPSPRLKYAPTEIPMPPGYYDRAHRMRDPYHRAVQEKADQEMADWKAGERQKRRDLLRKLAECEHYRPSFDLRCDFKGVTYRDDVDRWYLGVNDQWFQSHGVRYFIGGHELLLTSDGRTGERHVLIQRRSLTLVQYPLQEECAPTQSALASALASASASADLEAGMAERAVSIMGHWDRYGRVDCANAMDALKELQMRAEREGLPILAKTTARMLTTIGRVLEHRQTITT